MVRSLVSERSPTIVALSLAVLAASLTAIASPIAVGVLAGVALALATGSSRFVPRRPLELERGAPTPIGTAPDAASIRDANGSAFAARTVLERELGTLRAASFSDSDGDGDPSPETERTGDGGSRSATDLTRAEARDVLGVSLTADETEIRAAYRERVKAVHPDNGGDRAAFIRVTAAYERLTD